jgi:hypothetical protein
MINYQRCVTCGKELGTGDINGICQSCRNQGIHEFNATPIPSKITFETKQPIQVGDTFKADGNVWEVTKIDDEGVSIETNIVYQTYLMNVCPIDEVVWVYRKFKNGNTRGIWWTFSWSEIEMVHDIIEKLKGEIK